nr:hypothetical protein [Tanacetum cinerariifolium]
KTVENVDLKAQIQEKVFANVALKNELRKLKGNSMDTKFAKPSILGKLVLQLPRNQTVLRQPNAFKSERPNFSKLQFTSQVDVNTVLSKPVTPHYFPKVRELVFVKPHHVIASSSFRNSSKKLYGSNDMTHNYYLEEAKKKTQDKNMNLKPSVMHTTNLQNTTNISKPKPKSNNHTSWSLLVSKSSRTMWKPTGRIFKTAGLRITDSTTRVDNEPLNGSNKDITNPYECEQTLNVSAATLYLSTGTSFKPKKERLRVWLLKMLMSKNQVPQGIHKQEQEHLQMYTNDEQELWRMQTTLQASFLKEKKVFDEFFSPLASVASLVPIEEAPVPVKSTGSPSSTTVDQYVPSPSTSQTTPQSQSQTIPLCAEEESHDLEVAHMSNDTYYCILISETVSKESLS